MVDMPSEHEQAGLREKVAKICELHGVPETAYWNIADEMLQLFEATANEVIGEDERLDIQSDFDKLDVPHLETDKYPGLDGVRQASRNLLRGRQRQALSKLLGRGEEG